MLSDENFSQITIDGFDDSEREIIEQLIGEDIILRREVPSSGLASLGIENISFTYDELRDFLLAYYFVANLAVSNPIEIKSIFDKIERWPIYEGFFRYTYVLARKQNCDLVIVDCESSANFQSHFLNNLSLLSSDIQTQDDVNRIKAVLKDGASERDIRHVAWFLFRKRESTELLNVQILLDHVFSLNDEESKQFIRAMFSRSYDYGDGSWRDRVSGLLNSLKDLGEEEILGLGTPVLALALYFLPHANWEEREKTLNIFTKLRHEKNINSAIYYCQNSVSDTVKKYLVEIVEEQVNK